MKNKNIDQEKMNLEAAYKEAESDKDRLETINVCSMLDKKAMNKINNAFKTALSL